MFSSPQTSSGSRSLCPLLLSRIPLLTNIFSCSLFFVSRVRILVSCFTEKVNLAHTNQSRGLLLTNHRLQLPDLGVLLLDLDWELLRGGLHQSAALWGHQGLKYREVRTIILTIKECVNGCLSLEFLFLNYQSNACGESLFFSYQQAKIGWVKGTLLHILSKI